MSTPANATELYEFMRTHFGTGDYDDTSTTPYWRYAQREAGKIKSISKRRQLSIETLYEVALYALSENIPIGTVYDLLEIYPASRVAARRAAKGDPREALLAAAAQAQAAGRPEWATRLYAAEPSVAAVVLAEWEAAK